MSRILVLGGYGGFGARISRRLAAAGHEVLVAGRSSAKAAAFCTKQAGLTPLGLDRAQIAAALAAHRPDAVVDASGPFQAMDYAVPRACIAARVPYCDIADGRAFVCGIAVLDAEARAAGVPVISGASSVPALSGAVVRALAEGMERVSAVEMAISASNRASAGPAVAAAILAQVGQPFTLRRGGREAEAYGWQEPERIGFALPGASPIAHRRVALVEVPDVALLPPRLPGRPSVVFRAGTELAVQNLALWLASWPVRWGWLRSLSPFAPWLAPLQRLTARLGGDRSAMRVSLFGQVAGGPVERRWTLIADAADGPEIPALSVPLVVARMLRGEEPPGARDAGTSLELADYAPVFATLAIRHGWEERPLDAPVYRRVMGPRFDALAPALRAMHAPLRDGGAFGEAEVIGAERRVGALTARVMRFPPPGRHALHVHFAARGGEERWTRSFGSHRFSSILRERDGQLVERFGALRFHFALAREANGLAMEMRRWTVFGVPLPLALAPRSRAREWEEDGRFRLDVPIALPLVGRIVHYRGWLGAMPSHSVEPDAACDRLDEIGGR